MQVIRYKMLLGSYLSLYLPLSKHTYNYMYLNGLNKFDSPVNLLMSL